jgi:hypothetical protein
MPHLSADELITLLERKYHFIHHDHEEVEELDECLFVTLGEDALVFNYEGDYITECEEPEESGVDKIYRLIRKSGWSLEEHPLDTNCWILYPTDSLNNPITS